VPDDLVIARNPDPDSTLPYLIRIPLGEHGIVVKARETWPRTSKLYCHRADEWPDDAEIVERLPVRSVGRRGAAIDLVLARGRENRSQFVMTVARGREMIFWQSARTAKQARPQVSLPTARAHGQVLDIVVDVHERYAYGFSHQQATTRKSPLRAGDYAITDGDEVIAAVERKSVEDLSSTLLSGRMTYLMADLASLPRAAVVVEAGYSRIFKLQHASGTAVAESLAETQARFPSVPIVFCDNRSLAQEWVYRWFGACRREHDLRTATEEVEDTFAPGGPLPEPGPPAARRPPKGQESAIRAWARSRGLAVSTRGRLSADLRRAWEQRDAE
jgi:hypothetical protein